MFSPVRKLLFSVHQQIYRPLLTSVITAAAATLFLPELHADQVSPEQLISNVNQCTTYLKAPSVCHYKTMLILLHYYAVRIYLFLLLPESYMMLAVMELLLVQNRHYLAYALNDICPRRKSIC